jgi:hypothetical protein
MLKPIVCRNPSLRECEDELTFPKWGFGSPPKLPKFQSLIAGVETPCIGAFFISLESYQSVDVDNRLAWAI